MMCHPTQFEAARTESGYDFRPCFEDIQPYTSNADLTLANLETTLAGKEMTYSGYPSFNTPEQFALAIKESLGVDVLSTANNHSLDRNFSGLVRTLSFLDQYGLKHTGTYANQEDSKKILFVNIKGIKIAFLSYTYGTNGVSLPSGKTYAVNYISKEKMRSDAQRARDTGANLIIASIHWGQEYANQPSSEQQSLARWLFENTDINIIAGNHVHAVQPIEFLHVKDRDTGLQKEGLVIYAQGNFVSDQQTIGANKGIIVNITLGITPQKHRCDIQLVQYIPCWVDETPGAGLKTYRALNIEKALKDFRANKDSLLSRSDYDEMLDFSFGVKKIIPPSERIQYADSFTN
ncbi:MAG: CapA family protein [Peptococcaceae bacterium]|nr:CapA family protein [Peptococcaceae bacterium]